jgi:MOSC domain-containing protein YiiM
MMRLLSVNVGTPQFIGTLGGEAVVSGIVKAQVHRPVRVTRLNLEGDRQADLAVHGGEEKAVYLYPSEHYPYWREKFPHMELPWGAFGENLTAEGLLETEVHAGDRLEVGTSELEVTMPRFPCSKLGLRFGTEKMIRMFLQSGRTGFYLRVVGEGIISAGDPVRLVAATPRGRTIADIVSDRSRPERPDAA